MTPLFVSVSQLKRFKTCQRLWDFESRQKLVPKDASRSDALAFGSAIHDGLEHFHGPNGPAEGRLAVALKALDGSLGDEVMQIGDWDIPTVDPYERARVRGTMRAYAAYENRRSDWPAVGVLKSTERGFPDFDAAAAVKNAEIEKLTLGWVRDHEGGRVRVVLTGRWDGYGTEQMDAVVEHKTMSSADAVRIEDLAIDEQVSGMCWAASRLYDRAVGDCVYNMIVKPSWKAKPRGKEESPDEFEFRVAEQMLQETGKYFPRLHAVRTPEALEAWRESVLIAAEQMVSGKYTPALRGSWDGPCRPTRCNFHEVCASWHNQQRREALLAGSFERRKRY